jgi:hypothetical protein
VVISTLLNYEINIAIDSIRNVAREEKLLEFQVSKNGLFLRPVYLF